MADLSDIQSAQSVKIIGSDVTGLETTPVKATTSGELRTDDIVDGGGVQGNISVSTTAIAVRVGGSNLADRKRLSFWNNGTATLYWGYTAGVTSTNGFPIMRNQFVSDSWGPNTTIYIIAVSGSHDVRVNEAA